MTVLPARLFLLIKPRMAVLALSVAQEVKMISEGFAPSRAAVPDMHLP
jgi:hypothetical protein